MTKSTGAKVIKAGNLDGLSRDLPENWVKAIGILKDTDIDPVKAQREMRKAWGKRLEKLEALLRKS